MTNVQLIEKIMENAFNLEEGYSDVKLTLDNISKLINNHRDEKYNKLMDDLSNISSQYDSGEIDTVRDYDTELQTIIHNNKKLHMTTIEFIDEILDTATTLNRGDMDFDVFCDEIIELVSNHRDDKFDKLAEGINGVLVDFENKYIDPGNVILDAVLGVMEANNV